MDAAIETLVEATRALPAFDDTTNLLDLLTATDLLAARVSAVIDRVDRGGAVGVDGAVNTASWLRRFARRTYRDAAAVVRRAVRLRDCPAVTTAGADGQLSTGQIDVIVATVTDRTATLFTEHAADVVATLVGLSVRDTERVMRYWAHHANAPTTTTRRRPHVQVVMTLADLEHGTGTSVDGDPVDAATVAALLCDAAIHRSITNGQSVTLDAGRATRIVNHHLFTALAFRDQGCRFPG